MLEPNKPNVAIVDYGMGNLFSVKHACEHVGLAAIVTSSRQEMLSADAVMLPGVGAFGDAMDTLRKLNLVTTLQEMAFSSKPLVGICLGMQLLMSASSEFGHHVGLGVIPGTVVPFENPLGPRGTLKVPQVGWNRLYRTEACAGDPWADSLLDSLPNGVYMYFVHSFYVETKAQEVVVATSRYGDIQFCSSLRYRNISAFQCHPERSGPEGLRVYQNLLSFLLRKRAAV